MVTFGDGPGCAVEGAFTALRASEMLAILSPSSMAPTALFQPAHCSHIRGRIHQDNDVCLSPMCRVRRTSVSVPGNEVCW
jgi:hypothetical protein